MAATSRKLRAAHFALQTRNANPTVVLHIAEDTGMGNAILELIRVFTILGRTVRSDVMTICLSALRAFLTRSAVKTTAKMEQFTTPYAMLLGNAITTKQNVLLESVTLSRKQLAG